MPVLWEGRTCCTDGGEYVRGMYLEVGAWDVHVPCCTEGDGCVEGMYSCCTNGVVWVCVYMYMLYRWRVCVGGLHILVHMEVNVCGRCCLDKGGMHISLNFIREEGYDIKICMCVCVCGGVEV